MMMRYLYRAVHIRAGLDMLALCHTLQKYATGNGIFVGTRSPSQWTRRLDITMRIKDSTFEDLDGYVECLTDVIRHLPKLEIISFEILDSLGSEPVHMPVSVLDALRCSANSLRILNWSDPDFFPQLHQLEEPLRDFPNLRILHCPYLVWADGIIPGSILSSLTTLAVRTSVSREGHPGEGELPEACVSPRELIVETELQYGGLLQDFITRYGACLTTVEWYGYSHWIAEGLGLLHKSCPNLSRLILSLDRLASYDHFLEMKRFFSRVSFLGVELRLLSYQELLQFLACPRNHVSTLRVFQLMNSYTVGQLLDSTHSLGVSSQVIAEKLSEN